MADMKTLRLRIFALLCAVWLLLSLPGLFWPAYLDSPMGLGVAVPYLSLYAFDMVGIPGLLQNNGACGWGWCAPSTFGWIFIISVWLGIAWLLACLIAWVLGSRRTAP